MGEGVRGVEVVWWGVGVGATQVSEMEQVTGAMRKKRTKPPNKGNRRQEKNIVTC